MAVEFEKSFPSLKKSAFYSITASLTFFRDRKTGLGDIRRGNNVNSAGLTFIERLDLPELTGALSYRDPSIRSAT